MADEGGERTKKSTEATVDGRRPYVRIVTDKRREQNRRAQKAYRDRQRKKLDGLEGQAAIAQPSVSKSVDVTNVDLDGSDSLHQNTRAPTQSRPSIINLADAFSAAGDLPIGQASDLEFSIRLGPGGQIPQPEVDECLHEDDYGDLDLRQIWESKTTDQSHAITVTAHEPGAPVPSARKQPKPAAAATALSTMPLTPQRSHHCSPHQSRTLTRPYSSKRAVADPYVNHMRLVGEGNIEASLAVGLAINISRTAYVNDHPSHFPKCYVTLNKQSSSTSPFSTPVTVNYRFYNTVLSVSQELFDHMEAVQPALRPTPTQLLHPHPSYLDCIVFPYFRDQAVRASAAGTLDHMALFLDIIMHGGMVCWGGTSGLTNRHSRRAAATSRRNGMRDSVAWSTRSWEAKRWFLRKWSHLVGTEQEELARGDHDGIWRASRWWWDMRGEDDGDADYDDDDDGVDNDNGQGQDIEGTARVEEDMVLHTG